MPDPRFSPRFHTLVMAVACEGGLAAVAWLLGLLLARPPLAQMHATPEAATWGLLASAPLLVVFLLVTHFPIGPLRELQEIVVETVLPMFRDSSWAELAVISALAGLGEEMLFRGVVQEAISHRFGPWLGLTAASIAFGLAHPLNKSYAVLAGLIGAYLGGLWMATDNLLVPVIAHACYDFLALVYLLRRSPHG